MRILYGCLFVFFVKFAFAGVTPFAFIRADLCLGDPAIGTPCRSGTIYAGQFDGGKYMVTPSGCTDSATPTCAGGTDTVTKTWRGSTGSATNIPGVENVDSDSSFTTASSSSFRGDVNTAAMVAHASISSDSAADFCNDISFGGYSDWYLPSKSELAYIYCHSNAPSHNTIYPQEDTNCTSYGGKTSELTGFADWYWTSTEHLGFPAQSNRLDFRYGKQGRNGKTTSHYIRCIRRY